MSVCVNLQHPATLSLTITLTAVDKVAHSGHHIHLKVLALSKNLSQLLRYVAVKRLKSICKIVNTLCKHYMQTNLIKHSKTDQLHNEKRQFQK